jgi:hypothetical protein
MLANTAGAPVPLVEQQPVPVEVVGHRLEQHEDAEQHGQMDARGRGDLVPRRLQPHPAEDVVHGERADQRQHHGGEQDAEHEPLERIGECVVGDVHPELGIVDAEPRAVAPQQPGLPLGLRGDAGEDTEHRADHHHDQLAPGLQGRPVTLEVLLLERHRPERRPEPVGHEQVGRDDDGHQQAEQREQQHPGAEVGGEDLPVADLAEPEPVDVEPDQRTEHGQGEHEQDDDADDDLGASRDGRHRQRRPHCHELCAPD